MIALLIGRRRNNGRRMEERKRGREQVIETEGWRRERKRWRGEIETEGER